MFSAPQNEIDPVAESAGRHLRRAQALLTAGQRVFARLYLTLLALAFQEMADIEASSDRDPSAVKRSAANILAAERFVKVLIDAGFGHSHVDIALALVTPLPIEEHPFERIGSVVANIWRTVPNPHWDNREMAAGGFQIRVEARLKGEAYVDAYMSFPDAARSYWRASKLCATHEDGKVYAGKIAALFDALIVIEQRANAIAPPAPREALQTVPEGS